MVLELREVRISKIHKVVDTVIDKHPDCCPILFSSSHSRQRGNGGRNALCKFAAFSLLFPLPPHCVSVFIFKAIPKIRVILVTALHLEIWKIPWVPE